MTNDQEYFFYIIQTNDQKLYAGTSNDYLKRFETHKAKKGARFTQAASRHPLTLIFAQSFESKSEALKFEIKFKKLNREQKLNYINQSENLVATPIF